MNVRTRIATLAAAATLSATVLGIGATTAGAVAGQGVRATQAGDPGQWGGDRAAAAVSQAAERKVNEYEGQHRKVNEYEGQH